MRYLYKRSIKIILWDTHSFDFLSIMNNYLNERSDQRMPIYHSLYF